MYKKNTTLTLLLCLPAACSPSSMPVSVKRKAEKDGMRMREGMSKHVLIHWPGSKYLKSWEHQCFLNPLDVLGRQIEEVAQCVFHSLLIYRSVGKITYTQEAKYSTGTLGFVDVDCDFIDLTYVRLACDQLDQHLKREISVFRDALRVTDGPQSGEICLEFYQKKRARWPFQAECIPWELWTLKMDVVNFNSEHERNAHRQNLGMALAEKIMFVADNMSHHQYVPKTPNQNEVDLVFDTSYDVVQPYLFRITHQGPGVSVGNTMRKFLKDTLML